MPSRSWKVKDLGVICSIVIIRAGPTLPAGDPPYHCRPASLSYQYNRVHYLAFSSLTLCGCRPEVLRAAKASESGQGQFKSGKLPSRLHHHHHGTWQGENPRGSSSFSCSHHDVGAQLNLGSGGYLAAYPVSSSLSSTRQGWLNPRGCWYPIVIITISKAGLGQTPGGPSYLTAVPVGPTHAQQALRLSEQRLREATSTLHFGPDNPSWDCVIKINF